MALSDLVKAAREQNAKDRDNNNLSDAEKIRKKLTTKNSLTREECFELQREISEFMKSDASEKDKQMVRGYAESLYMLCSAIEQNLL